MANMDSSNSIISLNARLLALCTLGVLTTPLFCGGSIKGAQAMGAVAAAFGGILWVGCLFMLFFRFPAWLFKTVGGLYIFCFATQMLTLLVLNEDLCNGDAADALKLQDPSYQCSLGQDGATSIVAGIFFFLAIGITILVCPVPKTQVITCCNADCCTDGDEEGGGCCGGDAVEEAQNVTVTEIYNDDGTVTVKEERLNRDGTVTVSMTTRPVSNKASASV
mmetsp:Transcript_6658/g.8808  ORF Transcript_6658/g.8808 Transcript_6658/m.8808 type:complete len:221 (+) Transcript_6658:240-902(+)